VLLLSKEKIKLFKNDLLFYKEGHFLYSDIFGTKIKSLILSFLLIFEGKKRVFLPIRILSEALTTILIYPIFANIANILLKVVKIS